MSTMKNLDEQTVGLYINPCLALMMLLTMWYKGLTFEILHSFGLYDWVLVFFFSIATVEI